MSCFKAYALIILIISCGLILFVTDDMLYTWKFFNMDCSYSSTNLGDFMPQKVVKGLDVFLVLSYMFGQERHINHGEVSRHIFETK